LRTTLHYLFAVVILVLYGTRVCPFLESLSTAQLGIPIAATLFSQWVIRRPLLNKLVNKAPLENQVRRLLSLEFSLFALSGVLLAGFNTLYYDFPIESGLKVIIGFLSIGFFTSIDLALERERVIAKHCQSHGIMLEQSRDYFPVSRKLALFAAVTAIMVTTIFFLVINKDLSWLMDVSQTIALSDARNSILKEFIFVAFFILLYVLNAIRSYAKNLKLFFDSENQVLVETNRGNLDGRVAISTNDEFGIMAHQTNLMVEAIRQRTQEIQRTQDVTILSLASLAETRDNETGAHILRTQRYVRALANHLATQESYREALDPQTIDLLFKSAPLHDIGKVGIPDAILLKPGKLSDDEFEIMKTHAMLGSKALEEAEQELGGTSFLRYAREIAENHHEKWDGSGYPSGLRGKQIPLSGRLMSLADVYDALISKRVYKPAFPHEKARDIILEGNGSHFDPDIVAAFQAIEEEFKEIAASFSDAAYGQD
jgi:HD-GYP domain-containing protein (c-di-GMP phosphodiesterase class II)